MREPARASFWRIANGISMPASVSWKISRAICFRSDTFECANAGLRNVDVLILGAVADADCAHANSIDQERQTAAHGYLASLSGQREPQRKHHIDFISGACRRRRE